VCIRVSVDLRDRCMSGSVYPCISGYRGSVYRVHVPGGTVEGVERPPLMSQEGRFRSGMGLAAVVQAVPTVCSGNTMVGSVLSWCVMGEVLGRSTSRSG